MGRNSQRLTYVDATAGVGRRRGITAKRVKVWISMHLSDRFQSICMLEVNSDFLQELTKARSLRLERLDSGVGSHDYSSGVMLVVLALPLTFRGMRLVDVVLRSGGLLFAMRLSALRADG